MTEHEEHDPLFVPLAVAGAVFGVAVLCGMFLQLMFDPGARAWGAFELLGFGVGIALGGTAGAIVWKHRRR